jgi:hypothetical protein
MVVPPALWRPGAWLRLILLLVPMLTALAQDPSTRPTATRKVLFEEFTGEWCSLCPGGSIEMDRALRAHAGSVVPISYHDNDPLEVAGLNAMLDSIPFDPLYPGGSFDRLPLSINNPKHKMAVDRFDFLSTLATCVQSPARAAVDAQVTIDRVQRRVAVTVRAEFFSAEQGDFRIQCVLTENDVQRNGLQLNAYDKDSVSYPSLYGAGSPLRIWSHRYVARAILGGAAGTAGVIPQSPAIGTSYQHTYSFSYAPSIGNIDKLGVAVFVHRYKNKSLTGNEVLNANGYLGSEVTAVSYPPPVPVHRFAPYPNPCSGIATVHTGAAEAVASSAEVYDVMGRRMEAARIVRFDRGIQLDLRTLPEGLYLVRLVRGNTIESHPLLLNR